MRSYLKIDYLNGDMVKIHAHLCGDGNLYEKLEKRSPSNMLLGRVLPFKRQIIEYTNTNQLLLDRFQSCIRKVAPKTYIYRDKDRIQIRNKPLFLLMKKWGCGKSLDWSIPEDIISNPSFRRQWLAAFFDDEGSITKSGIFFYSSNKKGILQIKRMLEMEGMKLSLYKQYFKRSNNPGYTIRIRTNHYGLFIKLIKFSHPNKKVAYRRYFIKK